MQNPLCFFDGAYGLQSRNSRRPGKAPDREGANLRKRVDAEAFGREGELSGIATESEVGNMAETSFWWVFSFAVVFAFFLGYGMVEDIVRYLRKARHSKYRSP